MGKADAQTDGEDANKDILNALLSTPTHGQKSCEHKYAKANNASARAEIVRGGLLADHERLEATLNASAWAEIVRQPHRKD
jgi:hypothetical protein